MRKKQSKMAIGNPSRDNVFFFCWTEQLGECALKIQGNQARNYSLKNH